MRTVGVDLSSKPKKTAMCEIEWGEGRAYVRDLALNVDDQAILDREADLKKTSKHDGDWAIGIDAPFGWPETFIEFISHKPANGCRPITALPKDLYYRLTDLKVIAGPKLHPLSVAADKIAHPAIRCAVLLDKLGVVDRSGVEPGVSGVLEVYPAAALKHWKLSSKGYKTDPSILKKLFCEVCDRCDPWLTFAPGTDTLCETNDDAFDALIAALVTRAAALGRTIRPDNAEMSRARTEGWIAIPNENCKLCELVA